MGSACAARAPRQLGGAPGRVVRGASHVFMFVFCSHTGHPLKATLQALGTFSSREACFSLGALSMLRLSSLLLPRCAEPFRS